MSAARLLVATLLLAAAVAAQDLTPFQHYEAVYSTSTRPIEAFSKIVRDRPEDAWARHFHAQAFLDGRDLHAAGVALDHALRLDSKQPFHHRLRGDLESLRGDQAAAARAYRAAAALESRPEPRAYFTALAEETERVEEEGRRTVTMLAITLGSAALLGAALFVLILKRA